MNEKTKSENSGKKVTTHSITGTNPMPSAENLPTNTNIVTHYCDMMQLVANSDGITSMHFYSRQPGCNIEECRIALPNRVAIEIASVIQSVFGEIQPPAPKLS